MGNLFCLIVCLLFISMELRYFIHEITFRYLQNANIFNLNFQNVYNV